MFFKYKICDEMFDYHRTAKWVKTKVISARNSKNAVFFGKKSNNVALEYLQLS